jgi:hypothetical protein
MLKHEDAPEEDAPEEDAPAEEAPATGGGLEDIAADMEGTEGDSNGCFNEIS